MGLFKKSCYSGTATSANYPAPNPNPGRFEILKLTSFGKNVVAEIKYPDCVNFEGIKICVYINKTCDDIRNMQTIDPHFSNDDNSPFARFQPTEAGILAACSFAADAINGRLMLC